MRALKRLFWCAALSALMLLAFSQLVRGPEDEAPPPSRVPPGPTAVFAREAADLPLSAQTPVPSRRDRERETAAAPVRLRAVPLIASDRNGTPLNAATWAESGYMARPPEGMFG